MMRWKVVFIIFPISGMAWHVQANAQQKPATFQTLADCIGAIVKREDCNSSSIRFSDSSQYEHFSDAIQNNSEKVDGTLEILKQNYIKGEQTLLFRIPLKKNEGSLYFSAYIVGTNFPINVKRIEAISAEDVIDSALGAPLVIDLR